MRGADTENWITLGCYGIVILGVLAWWAFVIFMIVRTAQHFGII